MPAAVDLVRLAPEHVEELAGLMFKNWDDLRTVNPSRHEEPFTLETAREAVSRSAEESDHRIAFAVICDGEVVGDVGISGITPWPLESANVGVFIDRHLRGRGIGTVALGRACEIGFGELGLHRLEAGAQPSNTASLTMIRRNGFTEIGLAPGFLCVDGVWRDHILFQKLAPSS